MTDDFYDLFGVSPDADRDALRAAYRERVHAYHPDRNDDPRARAQFTVLRRAYNVLSDPDERRAYDRLGHETYVARRTNGLPSPDVWQRAEPGEPADGATDDDAAATAESRSTSARTTSTGSRAAGTADAGAAGAAGASANTDASAGTSTSRTATRGTGTGSRRSSTDPADRSAVGRWWRRRNAALPLLWASLAVYVAGLVHFVAANGDALETIRTELAATGGDPGSLGTVLAGGRYGLETTVGFVTGVDLLAPPLEPALWTGLLAAAVVVPLAAILAARVGRPGDPLGLPTMGETVVVALAVGTATTLVGGPLLAGTVLVPLSFGVVVAHTRRGGGWTPSILYLVPVLAPVAGFAAVLAGYDALAVDLVAFVLAPVLGGLWLPLRATLRKRSGR